MLKIDELHDHPHATYLIQSLLKSGNIPQTYLFYGSSGVGKLQYAKAFAASLLLRYSKSLEAAQYKLEKDVHPDLRCYKPDAKSHLYPAATLKEFMTDMELAPFESFCKVFILDEAEKMLIAGSNSLLKSLEEPPLDTYVILVSSSKEFVLPTIQSRALKVGFHELSEEKIEAFLVKEGKLQSIEAKKLSKLARGSYAKASRLIEAKYQIILKKLLIQLISITNSSYQELFQVVHELGAFIEKQEDLNFAYLEDTLELMGLLYRDIKLFSQEALSRRSGVFFDFLEISSYPSLGFSLAKIMKKLELCRKGIMHHIKAKHSLEALVTGLKDEIKDLALAK